MPPKKKKEPPPPVPATGVSLHKKGWCSVGALLGEGAQGQVYRVDDDDARCEYDLCVKAAALPAAADRGLVKKRKQMHADALNHEQMLYRNSKLAVLQGSMLPRLPSLSVVNPFQEAQGFRFLIMEAMELSFFDIVPTLCADASPTIDLGAWALRILDIIDAFHATDFLVIDAKPDNFMFAHASKNCKTLIQRLRMLDLGLAKRYYAAMAGKPVESTVTEPIGTPLYRSLHADENVSPTFRDDFFCAVMIVAELAIRLQAHIDGTTRDFESTPVHSYLPWSQEQSDTDVAAVKRAQVLEYDSEFYQRMPENVDRAFYRAFEVCHEMNWDEAPNSTKVRNKLKKLVINKPATKKKPAKRPARTTGSTSTTASAQPPRTPPRTNGKVASVKKTRAQQQAAAKAFMKQQQSSPSPKRKAATPSTFGSNKKPSAAEKAEDRRRAKEFMERQAGGAGTSSPKKPAATTTAGRRRPPATRRRRAEYDDDSDDDSDTERRRPPATRRAGRREVYDSDDDDDSDTERRRPPATRRAGRREMYDSDDDDDSDTERRRPPATRRAGRREVYDSDNDVVMEDVVDSDNNDSFHSADDGVDEDENRNPESNHGYDYDGYAFFYTNGPDKGQMAVSLKEGESIVIGNKKAWNAKTLILPGIPRKFARISLLNVTTPKLQIFALDQDERGLTITVNGKPADRKKDLMIKAHGVTLLAGDYELEFVVPS